MEMVARGAARSTRHTRPRKGPAGGSSRGGALEYLIKAVLAFPTLTLFSRPRAARGCRRA